MNIGVVGSRSFHDYDELKKILDSEIKHARLYKPDRKVRIVSGGARGADTLARRYAYSREDVEYTEHRPDWKKYGRKAGIVRNFEVIKNSGRIIAFWNGKSKGTKHVITAARQIGKHVKVVRF
jgi:hypothetical protein